MLLGEGLIWFNFLPLRSHIIVTGFGGPTASQVNVKEVFLVTFTSLGCFVKVGKPALRQPDTLRLCSLIHWHKNFFLSNVKIIINLPSTSTMMGLDSITLLLTLSLHWYSPESALWTLTILWEIISTAQHCIKYLKQNLPLFISKSIKIKKVQKLDKYKHIILC